MSTVYFVLLCGAVVCSLSMVSADCPAWSRLSQTMTHRPEIEMTCHVHTDTCYGLDCSGTYRFAFSLLNQPVVKKEIDFCLGIQINECSRPPSMDVHIQVPEKDSVFSQRFLSSDTRKMNMTYTIYSSVEADGFANVTFVSTPKYFLIGVMLKIRVDFMGMYSTWPEDAQRQLVPITKMPRATCQSTHTAPPLQPAHACKPLTWVTIQPPSRGTTVEVKSQTYNKPCSMGQLMNSCGPNEVCEATKSHAVKGLCICDQGKTISPFTGFCQGPEKPITRISTSKVVIDTTPSLQIITTKGSPTAIIIGSVVGGVVLIAFVVLVIIFYRRRRNSPYRNHDALLSNEDEIM